MHVHAHLPRLVRGRRRRASLALRAHGGARERGAHRARPRRAEARAEAGARPARPVHRQILRERGHGHGEVRIHEVRGEGVTHHPLPAAEGVEITFRHLLKGLKTSLEKSVKN